VALSDSAVFIYDVLIKAYREATAEVTDDAQIVELAAEKLSSTWKL